jgi:hypothetical protein
MVDGAPATAGRLRRGYSENAADTPAATAIQLMHRKRVVMRAVALFTAEML